MDEIRELAERRGLRVIEDAAQAHGARWNGKRTGSPADAAAFSFYPAKNLGACRDGVARAYCEGLSGIGRCIVPEVAEGATHTWHAYAEEVRG